MLRRDAPQGRLLTNCLRKSNGGGGETTLEKSLVAFTSEANGPMASCPRVGHVTPKRTCFSRALRSTKTIRRLSVRTSEGAVLLAAAKVSILRCLVLEGGHMFFCFHGELETALKYLAPRLETLALIGGATYTVRGCKTLVQDVIDMLGEESMQLSSLRTLQFGEVCNDDGIPRGFRRRKVAGVLRTW